MLLRPQTSIPVPDINQDSLKTELVDRVLWIDGDSSYYPKDLPTIILNKTTANLFCTELSEEIRQFNKLNPTNKISVKTTLNPLDTGWNIPEYYMTLNLFAHIVDKFIDICIKEKLTKKQIKDRFSRIKMEYDLFEQSNLIDMLRTSIYIVDQFKHNNIVWGTGRGSSCTSYILFIIELHNVDSFLYDLDINEFIR